MRSKKRSKRIRTTMIDHLFCFLLCASTLFLAVGTQTSTVSKAAVLERPGPNLSPNNRSQERCDWRSLLRIGFVESFHHKALRALSPAKKPRRMSEELVCHIGLNMSHTPSYQLGDRNHPSMGASSTRQLCSVPLFSLKCVMLM